MNILGISAFYHDSAACLIRDGSIIAAVQEERFTRIKHDSSFPSNAITFCLRYAGITMEQVDYVTFYEQPRLKFDRLIKTYLTYTPQGLPSFIQAMSSMVGGKLWMHQLIASQLGYRGPIVFPQHHESHAASAFFPSPFTRSAFLTMDGVGEWTTTSFGSGNGSKIQIFQELHFPHSLGLLYSAFTYYTGFKVNSGEYKVMGLAPYGTPKYMHRIYDKLIDLKDDGSFRINMEYFNFVTGFTMTNEKFGKLFGRAARKSEAPLTQMDMDLAASIQKVTEDIVIRIARTVKKETGEKNLCLAGGVALNCVANGKLRASGIFDDIWIQPASGDAGGALGAALFTWYHVQGNRRRVDGINDSLSGSYLGTQYSDEEIGFFLKSNNLPFIKIPQKKLVDIVSDLIIKQKVIGWFQGRMEYGPRALGNRSILADARSSTMQEVVNLKIKFRESFRPFAPSIIYEKVADWFEDINKSPYMLLVDNVVAGKRKKVNTQRKTGLHLLKLVRSQIPAVTHIDYSARVQTVHKETNPLYYALIQSFYRKTKCPVLLNTSFNVRGEPIVENPQDAYRCFMRTDMDFLVMGSYILDKKKQPPLQESKDWKKEFQLD